MKGKGRQEEKVRNTGIKKYRGRGKEEINERKAELGNQEKEFERVKESESRKKGKKEERRDDGKAGRGERSQRSRLDKVSKLRK